MTYPKLTDEELIELKSFATQEGRRWKEVLNYEYWFRGLPVPGFPLLYGLRNSHGPVWLDDFRFSKETPR